MLTYTTLRNSFGSKTDLSSENLTVGDSLINEAIREICSMKEWHFKQRQYTFNTVAGTQFYELPNDVLKVNSISAYVGSTRYVPIEVKSRSEWDLLNQSTSQQSTPAFFYIFQNQIGIYPLPATAYTFTVDYQIKIKDLTLPDYITGTITTATLADETIVGSGTSWTSKMNGRWLKIADSDSANTGDGKWYEILSVTNTTNLELAVPYAGVSISAGSASYIIGQCSIIPEDHQILPVYRACEIYYTSIKPELSIADRYKRLYQEGIQTLNQNHSSKSSNIALNRGYSPIEYDNGIVTE